MHTAGKSVVKNDCVGSCLMELQSFTLKLHQFVFWCTFQLFLYTGLRQVLLDFFLLNNEHRIYGY